jgi:hypothetical protein
MKYPNHFSEIEDPSPRVLPEIAQQIAPIIPQTVVHLLKDRGKAEVLVNASLEVFAILASRRLGESHADIESLRRALDEDADTALRYAHFIYKVAGLGCMLWLWHRETEQRLRLSEKREAIEIEWFERQSDDNPTSPAAPPPIPTKAPRTPTAARIEKFMSDVYEATGVKIDKTDIWLVAGYHSDREFRAFQLEQARDAIKHKFNRVLRMEPGEFAEMRDIKRKEHADRKAKSGR